MRKNHGFWIGIWLIAFGLVEANAQLMVELRIARKNFVVYESVEATVTVHNRSGRSAILSGPGQRSWLSFDVRDSRRNLVNRGRNEMSLKPISLGAGKSFSKKVNVGQWYPMSQQGAYRITANVYFPGTQSYFSSNAQLITVEDGKVFWDQVVGIADEKVATRYVHYSLLTYRGERDTQLYVRMADKRTRHVYASYSLGRIVSFRQPQVTVDGAGVLHALYMGAPRTYGYSQVAPTGEFLDRKVYSETAKTGTPQLMAGSDGEVRVQGGFFVDPNAPVEEKEPAKKLSERPDFLKGI